MVNSFIGNNKYKLAPEKIGLIDAAKRHSWEEEYASIVGEIFLKGKSIRGGLQKIMRERRQEYFKNKAQEKKLVQNLKVLGFFQIVQKRRIRRKLRQMNVRILGTNILLEKLRLIEKTILVH